MQKLGMKEGESIEHPWVSKAIENAQRKVEAHYFDARKNILDYDDVANDQRKIIYQQRNELMAMEDISDSIKAIRHDVVDAVISEYIMPGSLDEQWDIPGLEAAIDHEFGSRLPIARWLEEDDELHEESLRDKIQDAIVADYEKKEQEAGPEVLRHFEKAIMLQILDQLWKEHLAAMDYLRQGIHLRGYAQKNPKQEYKREAFEMFTDLLERIKREVIGVISKVQVTAEEEVDELEQRRRSSAPLEFQHADSVDVYDEYQGEGDYIEGEAEEVHHEPFVRDERKVGRNEPCPCGSGKKYKQCHGKIG
jgi:preprotein translocase subunit SecA